MLSTINIWVYQQFMIKTYLVLIFTALLAHPISTDQPFFQLTPILPPTAYVGQPYRCKFQVVGLTFLLFKVQGLPKQLSAESTGLIKGTPSRVGSFLITVSYSSQSYSSSKQTILRITQSTYPTSNKNSKSNIYPSFSIAANIDTFVFMAGTQVNITFTAIMGSPPYAWTYLRLPLQLNGNADGKVSGFFFAKGYYSFGVTCADNLGRSTDSYFTLNIQPLTFFMNWQPSALRPIVDVSPRDTYSSIEVQKFQKLYCQAIENVSDANQAVSKAQTAVLQAQKELALTNYALVLAKQYVQLAQRKLADITDKKMRAQQTLNYALKKLVPFNQTFIQKTSIFEKAKAITQSAQKNLQNIQKQFDNLQKALNIANTELINAQNNKTQALYNYTMAQIKYNDSSLQINITSSSQVIARQNYQEVKRLEANNIQQVERERGEVAADKLATTSLDNQFKNASQVSDDALTVLKSANKDVEVLRNQANQAQQMLGQAKYNLTITQNRLYIALAASHQALKASYIIASQYPSSAPTNTTFDGCDQRAYPGSFGSGKIQAVYSQGYLLQSGQYLLFGKCTIFQQLSLIGQLIQFKGYLKQGCIHLMKYNKIQFS